LTKPISPSESILVLPSVCLLNVRTLDGLLPKELIPSKECPSHPDHWKEDDDEGEISSKKLKLPLTSVQALTLALARWRMQQRNEKSKSIGRFDTMLSSFPKEYPTFPIMWKISIQEFKPSSNQEEEISQNCRTLLDALPTHVAHLCEKVYKRFQRDCRSIRALSDTFSQLLLESSSGNKVNLMDFAWAWCSVNSRCLFIPLGLKPHQDNFTLAPLLDMANHTMDPRLECKVKWTPTGGLKLSAPAKTYRPEGFVPGQEVMIAYGPHSNGVSSLME